MTDEQLSTLAQIVLTNQQRLDRLTEILVKVLESQAQAGTFGDNHNRILSLADQLAANNEKAKSLLPEAHKFFGLDEPAQTENDDEK